MRPMGVTTKNNIIPIINGEIIFPRKIPNLNQILFNGDKIEEFNKPKIKKMIEINIVENIILSPFDRGYNVIIKKNKKNTIPKFLLLAIFILLFFKTN